MCRHKLIARSSCHPRAAPRGNWFFLMRKDRDFFILIDLILPLLSSGLFFVIFSAMNDFVRPQYIKMTISKKKVCFPPVTHHTKYLMLTSVNNPFTSKKPNKKKRRKIKLVSSSPFGFRHESATGYSTALATFLFFFSKEILPSVIDNLVKEKNVRYAQ